MTTSHQTHFPKPSDVAALTDDALREEWRRFGGEIHGPNVETVTMPEGQYFAFRRGLAGDPA